MKSLIDLAGASGASYRYRLAEGDEPKTPMAGNYAYVRATTKGPRVLLVGETTNLSSGAKARWAEAKKKGATHLFYRLNVAGSTRAHELDDLLQALEPPMNGEAEGE